MGYNGDAYSWITPAFWLSYPILSINRLGAGNPTHPDPVTLLQTNLHEDVLHKLVLALKSGAVVPGKSFREVIYVGHPYDSTIGEGIAVDYPSYITAFILTGFGTSCASVAPAAAGINQTTSYPASEYWPRFAVLQPGYVCGYVVRAQTA